MLAHQVLVALVVRVDGDGGVPQHGLRAGGGDNHIVLAVLGLLAIGQGVAQVPEQPFLFLVFHFQVGDSGVQLRIPVHQSLAAVHQPFLVQPDEHFLHGAIEAVVHGEAFVVPVHGVAQAAHLTGDGAARLLLPLPDTIDECFPSQVVAGLTLFIGQLAFHHHLGGDAGMVGAHCPQGVTTLHAAIAGEGIHDGVLEGVAHVQAAGHVGRGDGNTVGLSLTAGAEIPFGFPVLIPLALNIFWLVGFFHGCNLVTG